MQRNVDQWTSWKGIALLAIVAIILLSTAVSPVTAATTKRLSTARFSVPVRNVTLTTRVSRLTIRRGEAISVWTYNGTVPGPAIRVVQGTRLRVTLVNRLPVGTTIHWHGLRGPNMVDGVPGVTQRLVKPGQRFTYSFTARDPGTYWYHSHQQSAEQVDRGLYGALVILPRRASSTPAIDRTLMLDEWPVGGKNKMAGMTMVPKALSPYLADPGMGAYRTFTVNGHAYPFTRPILARAGSLARLRLINAGYLTHFMHLHAARYRLVATDGIAINQPPETSDLLPIAPGQRMDIEFRMPRGDWSLHDHSGLPGAADMRVAVGQTGRPAKADAHAGTPPLLDLSRYGRPAAAPFHLAGRFDRIFRLALGQNTSGGMSNMPGMAGMSGQTTYTINGKTLQTAASLRVVKGQRIEVIYVNRSKAAHPMHIHGHKIQVLQLNGKPVVGSPLYQDTVMVLPGKATKVAFVADNPGVWMLHCHELHHAAGGMATVVQYRGKQPVAKGDAGE